MNSCTSLYMDIYFLYFWGKNLELEWLDHMVDVCVTFKKLLIVFQSGYTILHSHQEWIQLAFPLHPHQHLVWSVIFSFSHSNRCVFILAVVLICIFLMTYDFEHLFMGPLAVYISFFGEVSVQTFVPLKKLGCLFYF